MNNKFQKRYYTPQFSEMAAVSVRRFAWVLGISMPKAVDYIIRLLPQMGGSEKVCQACKDQTKCRSCVFCLSVKTSEQTAVMLGV